MTRILALLTILLLSGCNENNSPQSNNASTSVVKSPEKMAKDYSKIKEFTVVNSGYRELNGIPAAWVMFSKPVDRTKDINQYLSLSNNQGYMPKAWQLDDEGVNAYYTHIAPDTSYRIRIEASLVSSDKITLAQPHEKKFSSPDLSPSASFLQQGSVLNPHFSDGLPIMVVNQPWVEVNYYRVKQEHYDDILSYNATNKVYAWSVERLAHDGELVSTQKYDTKAETNQRIKRVLATDHINALREPGVYFAVLRTPNDYESYQVARFTISELTHEVREYNDYYLVTVVQQNDAMPAQGVSIQAYNYKNKPIASPQITSALGQVKVAKNKDISLLTFIKNNDFSVANLRRSQPLNLADFDISGRQNSPLELFVFGARDLYRRGEAITYYGLLKDQDGHSVKPMPVQAALQDPNGNVLTTVMLSPENGLYQFDFNIAPDALTGHYQLKFKLANQHFNHQFSVEDFMPQRLEITFDDAFEPLTMAGNTTLPLSGLFLYGAPASGHKVDGLLQFKSTNQAVTTLPNYYFGEHKTQGITDSFELNAIKLDQQGKGALVLQDRWYNKNQAMLLNGYAYLYEKSGRKVTKSFQRLWWPHQQMIGIKPHFDDLTSDSETQISFDILRSDLAGTLAKDDVFVSLIRHHKEYYWEHSNQEGWQRHQRSSVYPVWQDTIKLNDKDATTITAPVEWGEYELVVQSTHDKRVSRLFFDAGEDWYWRWSDNNNGSVRPDHIALALDKASYKEGDIAKVNIDAPYQGQAWLRIESDNLLWQQQVNLSKGYNQVEIPIKDWQRHDVYLTAYLITPMAQDSAIKRALGVAHLPLNRDERQLELTIDAPEKIKPNTTEKVTVNVANTSQQTHVVLAAVDVGVLNLHQFKTPDPFDFFFDKRRYDIAISDNLNAIIAPNNHQKANILWGGGAEMDRGGQQANAHVQIVSYLSKPQEVVNGAATFDVPVPYFNGRLRLFAIAYTKDEFASAEKPMTIADDIVSQINMPRFLAIGDSATLAVDLTNTSDIKQQLVVKISAPDLGIEVERAIALAPEENQSIALNAAPINAHHAAPVTLSITGEHYQTQRQWHLSVRHPYPAQRTTSSRTLAVKSSVTFNPDIGDWHKDLQSSVSLATRPQFELRDQVGKLYEFPLGCLEQTSSRLYPWLALPPKTQQQLAKELINIDRNELINKGVSRILSMQTYNGGLSLWGSNGNEAPWLSAYGAQVLLAAQQAGVYVPEQSLEKLLSRLAHYLRRGNFSGYGDMADYRFATRSYSAMVLASLSRANQSHMRQLMKKSRDSKSPLALVQLAVAFELMGDKKRALALLNTAKNKKFTQVYNGTYASKIRDNAMIINLLLKHELDDVWAQKLAFKLWKDKQSRHWFSTQERLALVLADSQLEQKFGDEFNYQLTVGDSQFTGPDSDNAFYRIDGMAITQSTLTNTSSQLLFVDQVSQGYPLDAPKRVSNGMHIRRDYYDMNGRPVMLKNLQSAQQYIVRIRAQSQRDSLKDVMVIDLLPAGFEIENSDFDSSVNLRELRIDGRPISDYIDAYKIDYQGYLDDRYIASISVNKYNETQLFYQVQVVTPGVFKHPPVMAQAMYREDITAIGQSGADITVK